MLHLMPIIITSTKSKYNYILQCKALKRLCVYMVNIQKYHSKNYFKNGVMKPYLFPETYKISFINKVNVLQLKFWYSDLPSFEDKAKSVGSEGTDDKVLESSCEIIAISNKIKKPIKNVLDPPSHHEEVDIIAPQLKPTFNLAAWVDKSETLKHFINLGVNIAKWERQKDICFDILHMDFENDIKPYIFFINEIGVPVEEIGEWLTKNPFIFSHSIENVKIRLNYLESKKFTKEVIEKTIRRTPKWVNYSIETIDSELGIFQRKFELSNDDVRLLVAKDPKLILYSADNKFFLERMYKAIMGQMGFSSVQQKQLLLGYPRIYRTNLLKLLKRFDIIYNEMGLSHDIIVNFPLIMGFREMKISERHKFLKFLGKNQYNPEKPNYISPKDFVSGTDAEFCSRVAKSSIEIYNDFLKTL